MMSFMDKFQTHTYALVRIVSGFLFLWHGTQKIFNFPIKYPYPLDGLSTAAGAIELVAGTLIMIGFLTRPAAFIASGTMAVGYWMVHGSQGLFPIANGGELAAIFAFVFLMIASQGSGIWSVDKAIY